MEVQYSKWGQSRIPRLAALFVLAAAAVLLSAPTNALPSDEWERWYYDSSWNIVGDEYRLCDNSHDLWGSRSLIYSMQTNPCGGGGGGCVTTCYSCALWDCSSGSCVPGSCTQVPCNQQIECSQSPGCS